jgi:polygalacturonase
MKPVLLIAVLLTLLQNGFAANYNIIDYGAKGDGATKNTLAIQKAIDACSKTGGRVIFPAGKFLSGTIILKSNVVLYFEAGATLLGSTDINDYPVIVPKFRSYADFHINRSLIYAENQENIGITGPGVIDGNGDSPEFHDGKKTLLEKPPTIRIISCRHVTVSGVHLENSAKWMQHYLACDFLVIKNITVYNHSNGNNDGLDVDGCHYVTISGCSIDSDDDAICLKSDSRRKCENVKITNCVASAHCNAIKIGTETMGGFRNIFISHCRIRPCADTVKINGLKEGISGIDLLIMDGGTMENVTVSHIAIDSESTPLFIRLGNFGRTYYTGEPKPKPGIIRNIVISNIVAKNAGKYSSSISGFAGNFIENVSLSNISISAKGGGGDKDTGKMVPENETKYPDAFTMYNGILPSYGLYIRQVKNIRLTNIKLETVNADERSALVMDDTHGISIKNLKAGLKSASQSLIYANQTTGLSISDSKFSGKDATFLQVAGGSSGNILLTHNNFTGVTKPVKIGMEVKKGAVIMRDKR